MSIALCVKRSFIGNQRAEETVKKTDNKNWLEKNWE
jgi:hypothetical protein